MHKKINIFYNDILKLAKNTLVSQANSYGYMDGVVDKCYTDYFGIEIQNIVLEELKKLMVFYKQENSNN